MARPTELLIRLIRHPSGPTAVIRCSHKTTRRAVPVTNSHKMDAFVKFITDATEHSMKVIDDVVIDTAAKVLLFHFWNPVLSHWFAVLDYVCKRISASNCFNFAPGPNSIAIEAATKRERT